jgi:hypothetical protein
MCVSTAMVGFAEGHVEHHVGGLAAHAGQRFQGFAGARHLAAVRSTRMRQVSIRCFALLRYRPMVLM